MRTIFTFASLFTSSCHDNLIILPFSYRLHSAVLSFSNRQKAFDSWQKCRRWYTEKSSAHWSCHFWLTLGISCKKSVKKKNHPQFIIYYYKRWLMSTDFPCFYLLGLVDCPSVSSRVSMSQASKLASFYDSQQFEGIFPGDLLAWCP